MIVSLTSLDCCSTSVGTFDGSQYAYSPYMVKKSIYVDIRQYALPNLYVITDIWTHGHTYRLRDGRTKIIR